MFAITALIYPQYIEHEFLFQGWVLEYIESYLNLRLEEIWKHGGQLL